MDLSFSELFEHLASFNPPKKSLHHAPWEAYVDWAIANGLGPLAAYNLEYKLGLSGAPQWAKDRLLSVYQAVANDNVMKLVNFKRTLDELEGRRVVVLGGACFAESLYPHVAFRPVDELSVWVSPKDVEPLVNFLKHASFVLVDETERYLTLSDTRSTLVVHRRVFEPAQDAALLAEASPMPVYGGSAYRLSLEASLLVEAQLAADAGYVLPRLQAIDLRELATGAPASGGFYSRTPDIDTFARLVRTHQTTEAAFTVLTAASQLFSEQRGLISTLLSALGTVPNLQRAEDNVKRMTEFPKH